jgi:DNA invertase Pin-like site-specific DNA recombinase
VLVVTKLDRLGRNSIDVQTTVKRLDEMTVFTAWRWVVSI